MLKNLIAEISKTVEPTTADIDLCKQYFEPVTVNRNTLLEAHNKKPVHLYFISSGCVRLFYVDESGEEKTTCLGSSNSFITSFLAFIHQQKTSEGLETITECNLLRITHENLKTLINSSENFKKFSVIIFEHAISSSTARANDLATLNAEQRYIKLMADQPQLIHNIPVKYIASFLGMKPESLSRIRRQLNS